MTVKADITSLVSSSTDKEVAQALYYAPRKTIRTDEPLKYAGVDFTRYSQAFMALKQMDERSL